MTNIERAVRALRECADALEHVPRRNTSTATPFSLRAEADWLEEQAEAWARAAAPAPVVNQGGALGGYAGGDSGVRGPGGSGIVVIEYPDVP